MQLHDKEIGILVEADYQDFEVHYPRLRLLEDGADVLAIGIGNASSYTGKYGYPIEVTLDIDTVDFEDLDGLILPGGWAPDKLRMSPKILQLVRKMDAHKRVIGCICHGGWVLSSAGILSGRKMTSYIAIKDDMINAGAEWLDRDVVIDDNLITSRKPDDLPTFMKEFIFALKR